MSLAEGLMKAALEECGARKNWLNRLPQGLQEEIADVKKIFLATRGKTPVTATALARQVVAFIEKEGHAMPRPREVQRWLASAD